MGLRTENKSVGYNCSIPFLTQVRKSKEEVEVYLSSGIRLLGFIVEFDHESIVFDGGTRDEVNREQLIFRSAISSIVPRRT